MGLGMAASFFADVLVGRAVFACGGGGVGGGWGWGGGGGDDEFGGF